MTKSELKTIIKECVDEILNERARWRNNPEKEKKIANTIVAKLKKNKYVASAKVTNWHGTSIELKFTEISNEIWRTEISPIFNGICDKYTNKSIEYSWDVKVENGNEALIVIDCYESYEESAILTESIVELGRRNSKNIDTTDIKTMREYLVKVSRSNKFKDNDYKSWSQSYSKESSEKCMKELPKYKLAYCLHDAGDDYLVYSEDKDRFYFFSHEQDGLENIEDGPKSLQWIARYINDWQN